MKKLLTILARGALGSFFIAKSFIHRKDMLHFAEQDESSAKNFGAFPVEIPEEQFEAMFV
ncbi:MAG: hypothetical protein L0Y80_11835 [Ignavibacteriae bacterium]|nr:hypothetical protein [Ignavibacteriota bacterium]